jgi:hypothetical protein
LSVTNPNSVANGFSFKLLSVNPFLMFKFASSIEAKEIVVCPVSNSP